MQFKTSFPLLRCTMVRKGLGSSRSSFDSDATEATAFSVHGGAKDKDLYLHAPSPAERDAWVDAIVLMGMLVMKYIAHHSCFSARSA
jgi:hypothetical protein